MILELIFKNETDFQRASDFFYNGSSNFSYDIKCVARCLGFSVPDKYEADILEKALETELLRNGFNDFTFEI